MPVQTVRIAFPSKLDALELKQKLGAERVTIEKAPSGHDLHGEVATATAIVVVSLAALRVLAAYLLKDRGHGVVTKQVQVTAADGTTRTEVISVNIDTSKAPEADVLKQLAAVCQVALPES